MPGTWFQPCKGSEDEHIHAGPEDTEAGPSAPAVHADGGSQDGGTPGPERLPESLLDQTMDGLEVPPEPGEDRIPYISCQRVRSSTDVALIASKFNIFRPYGHKAVANALSARNKLV